MMKRSLALTALMALAVPATATTPPPTAAEAADHDALRTLKADLVRAINTQDFETARTLIHSPMLATAVTQDSFNNFDKMVAFYKSLYTRDTLRMKKVEIQADADELSQIYTGTFAVTRGATKEHYELADGRGFDLKGRWTGVSIKDNGQWKVLAVHTGTNFLDNPVLGAIEKSVMWVGAGAGVFGLLIGFLLGRWRRRKA